MVIPAFSPFQTTFSKALFSHGYCESGLCGEGLTRVLPLTGQKYFQENNSKIFTESPHFFFLLFFFCKRVLQNIGLFHNCKGLEEIELSRKLKRVYNIELLNYQSMIYMGLSRLPYQNFISTPCFYKIQTCDPSNLNFDMNCVLSKIRLPLAKSDFSYISFFFFPYLNSNLYYTVLS